ncbi:LysR family transcriptional regulator [Celerinatantimonas yamalensis]|uniref:LysR family transcriptional regulator n=1 Tax=Celerinatantimonas yamalensis TaxID=559956 RepID=A0ABW9G7K6_9GAMM
MINLMTIDLNLLRTLDVLLDEQNVTRTAQRLYLSQPSVSVQLGKLRVIFNDPLLVPQARGMQPTALAQTLARPLKQTLADLTQLLSKLDSFDPHHSRQTWQISAADYAAVTIIQPASIAIRAQAPHTKLALMPLIPQTLEQQLRQGEIDIALHVLDDAPLPLRYRPLIRENYVLCARADHPVFAQHLSLNDFCALEHIIVSPNGHGFQSQIDQALAKLGHQRQVVLSVPHFLVMVQWLSHSNLVAMLPERLAKAYQLCYRQPPLEVAGFELMMLWHERSHRDPAQRWLREQLLAQSDRESISVA